MTLTLSTRSLAHLGSEEGAIERLIAFAAPHNMSAWKWTEFFHPPGCVACVEACPAEALKPGIPPVLSSERCMLCSACREACIHDAIQYAPDPALLKELSHS